MSMAKLVSSVVWAQVRNLPLLPNWSRSIHQSLPNPLWKMECLKNLQELHPRNKFRFQKRTISGTHLTLYWTSLRIPFLNPKSHKEWHIHIRKWANNHPRERSGITVTIAIGMVTLLSFALWGREMSSRSMSWTTGTCTTRPMSYMCRLFRGTMLG
jgi:hypothetical protein